MKAAYFTQTGGPEVIQVGDIPPPVLDNNGVLVKVRAASVNPIDTYIRGGANYWPLPNPYRISCKAIPNRPTRVGFESRLAGPTRNLC